MVREWSDAGNIYDNDLWSLSGLKILKQRKTMYPLTLSDKVKKKKKVYKFVLSDRTPAQVYIDGLPWNWYKLFEFTMTCTAVKMKCVEFSAHLQNIQKYFVTLYSSEKSFAV